MAEGIEGLEKEMTSSSREEEEEVPIQVVEDRGHVQPPSLVLEAAEEEIVRIVVVGAEANVDNLNPVDRINRITEVAATEAQAEEIRGTTTAIQTGHAGRPCRSNY